MTERTERCVVVGRANWNGRVHEQVERILAFFGIFAFRSVKAVLLDERYHSGWLDFVHDKLTAPGH